MAKAIVLSKRAIEGIEHIALYIADLTGSATAGAKYKARVNEVLAELQNFPERYPIYDPERRPGIRKKVIGKYTLIFYRLQNEIVYVSSIVDARTDWPSTL